MFYSISSRRWSVCTISRRRRSAQARLHVGIHAFLQHHVHGARLGDVFADPIMAPLPTRRRRRWARLRTTRPEARRGRCVKDSSNVEESTRLEGIESQMVALNGNPQLKNRNGPAKFPYMLLYPNTSDHTGQAEGLTARGIPNSISI